MVAEAADEGVGAGRRLQSGVIRNRKEAGAADPASFLLFIRNILYIGVTMTTDAHTMIKEFTSDLAAQVGIRLVKINFVEGEKVGCRDLHLMTLISKGHLVSVLAHQVDVENLQAGQACHRLETKIRSALLQLKGLLEA
jgi:hypothetical protein